MCDTSSSLDNCGFLGVADVYVRRECSWGGSNYNVQVLNRRAVSTEDPVLRANSSPSPPTITTRSNSKPAPGFILGISIALAVSATVFAICVAYMCYLDHRRKERRRQAGPGGPPLPVVSRQSFTKTGRFQRAEALVHVQRSRIRARERLQRAGDGSDADKPPPGPPQVLCLASVDPVTGVIQSGGAIPGRYVDVREWCSSRDSQASEESTAQGAGDKSSHVCNSSPTRIARDWLSGKMRRAEKSDTTLFGNPDPEMVDARVARARDHKQKRVRQTDARLARAREHAQNRARQAARIRMELVESALGDQSTSKGHSTLEQ